MNSPILMVIPIRMEGTVMLHISFAIKQEQVHWMDGVMNSLYSLGLFRSLATSL